MLKLLKRGVVVLERHKVCDGEDSEEHERNEGESLSRAGFHLVRKLSVQVASLTVFVHTAKVVEDRFTAGTNSRSRVGLSGHVSAFNEGFVGTLLVVETIVSILVGQLGLGIRGSLEHGIVGIAKMSKSNVVRTSHIVRRGRIVEARSVLFVFVGVGSISDVHKVCSLVNLSHRGSGGSKVGVSGPNGVMFLRHFGSEFNERSEDNHQDKVSGFLEHTLNGSVVVRVSSLHASLGLGGNESPDHN